MAHEIGGNESIHKAMVSSAVGYPSHIESDHDEYLAYCAYCVAEVLPAIAEAHPQWTRVNGGIHADVYPGVLDEVPKHLDPVPCFFHYWSDDEYGPHGFGVCPRHLRAIADEIDKIGVSVLA